MFNKIKNNFLTGLVVILPLILTIIIFRFLIKQINDIVLVPTMELLGLHFYNPYWVYISRGIGFLIIVLLIILIGLATRLLLLRKFFGFWEKLIAKVPMLGKIYITIKQISRAFLGQGKYVFDKVVLVEYPRRGIYSLGFITAEGCEEIQEKTKTGSVYVFLPTTPNPTNGFFLIIPKEEVVPLSMSVADAFKLIVSGGTFSPPHK
ncbi:MAG: DUF502 domain-containing protein [Candidatus Omnitrophota bacterium]|nr:MAG: DUF502 domain-containing protein [Candidatus Omnitrophota bacterium]